MCMYTHERDDVLLLLLRSTTQGVMTTSPVTLHRLGSIAGVSLEDKSILLRKI
jgi:hypothetical protein